METIAKAAIKTVDGRVFSVPRPGRHGDVFRVLRDAGADRHGSTQGFLTNTDRFVTRREAFFIAKDAQQIRGNTEGTPILFTEDLW